MTIARNIEAQLSNWTTGTATSSAIGTGGLYRGHSDTSPNTALAAGPDTDGYIGTGQSGFSIERRTHTLSNGEIIWDLSGNVWEWTNDTIMGVNKPTGGSEFTAMTGYGSLSYDLIRPSNTWNSTQNMGQYFVGSTTGGPFAFLRGGDWTPNSTDAGVFTLDLTHTPSFTYSSIGFRCVLR
jgi:formylglycine-generating enzyme required for sulfatase activity